MFVCLFVCFNHILESFPASVFNFHGLDIGDMILNKDLFDSKEGSSSMSDTRWIPQRYMQGYVVDP